MKSRSVLLFMTLVIAILGALSMMAVPTRAASPPSRGKAGSQPQPALRLHEYRRLLAARTAAVAAKFEADFERARNATIETKAIQELEAAKTDFEQSQASLESVSEERGEIERRLEAAADEISPLVIARRTYEERRYGLQRLREQLTSRGIALKSSKDYLRALREYESARSIYGRLRYDLFTADPAWQDNVEIAKTLKQQLKAAAEKMESQASQKSRASLQRKLAEKKSAAASATIQHAQSRGVTEKSKPQ